jgi:uncharacterized membrane protein YfcA
MSIHIHVVKAGIDWAAAGVIVTSAGGWLLGWLPPVLTILGGLAGLIWYCYQIYDLRQRRRNHRR